MVALLLSCLMTMQLSLSHEYSERHARRAGFLPGIPNAAASHQGSYQEFPHAELDTALFEAIKPVIFFVSMLMMFHVPTRFFILCPVSMLQIGWYSLLQRGHITSSDSMALLAVSMLYPTLREKEKCARLAMLRENTFTELLHVGAGAKEQIILQERRILKIEQVTYRRWPPDATRG